MGSRPITLVDASKKNKPLEEMDEASAFGRVFLQYQDWLARGAGVVVIILGLHFLRVIRIPFLDAISLILDRVESYLA